MHNTSKNPPPVAISVVGTENDTGEAPLESLRNGDVVGAAVKTDSTVMVSVSAPGIPGGFDCIWVVKAPLATQSVNSVDITPRSCCNTLRVMT